MSVRRFRSAADLPEPTPLPTPLAGIRAACEMSRLSTLFGHDERAPRGIRRFRSVEDASAHRRLWESGLLRDDGPV